uniref:Uncharacterized protein n=1 Tax=Branchiostoma floridae TaxID=7739 RepID=C3YWJ8_BRAFL|eukprot:XP_002599230.1 hypothetical protein BRAFLDRAFT_64421 [Branchiostoma floridae]
MPKRAKKCPGCGQDNSLHPNGRGNKHCKGISQPVHPVHSDTESEEATPPAGGKVKATADLERRKAELQEQLKQARLEKEVAELEEELKKARCSTEPAKETDPTLPKPPELHTKDPAHTSLLGPGDITLQQLRDNSPLQAEVTAKYPDLIGSRKKTEGTVRREGKLQIFNFTSKTSKLAAVLLSNPVRKQYYAGRLAKNSTEGGIDTNGKHGQTVGEFPYFLLLSV